MLSYSVAMKVAWVLGLATLIGCREDDAVVQAIHAMNAAADAACACATLECTRLARNDLVSWEGTHAGDTAKVTPTDQQDRQITAAQKRFIACAAKLLPGR